jgi:hypothetical protein
VQCSSQHATSPLSTGRRGPRQGCHSCRSRHLHSHSRRRRRQRQQWSALPPPTATVGVAAAVCFRAASSTPPSLLQRRRRSASPLPPASVSQPASVLCVASQQALASLPPARGRACGRADGQDLDDCLAGRGEVEARPDH